MSLPGVRPEIKLSCKGKAVAILHRDVVVAAIDVETEPLQLQEEMLMHSVDEQLLRSCDFLKLGRLIVVSLNELSWAIPVRARTLRKLVSNFVTGCRLRPKETAF